MEYKLINISGNEPLIFPLFEYSPFFLNVFDVFCCCFHSNNVESVELNPRAKFNVSQFASFPRVNSLKELGLFSFQGSVVKVLR